MEFIYKRHIDLVFHLLAQIKVDNASDLFCQAYIDKMEAMGLYCSEISGLTDYYNQNFERLAAINFLPFYADDLAELVQLFSRYSGFSDEDMKNFIQPFVDMIELISASYFEYWEKEFNRTSVQKQWVEKEISERLKIYQCLFEHDKTPLVCFSLSLTRNGRAVSCTDDKLTIMVPFPKINLDGCLWNRDDINDALFSVLHEYTHSITDGLVAQNINMTDGSHDLSEHSVILFDYCLIKSVSEPDVSHYLNWLMAMTGREIAETELRSIFPIPDWTHGDIINLVQSIIK